MIKTLRVFPANLRHVKQESLAHRVACQPGKSLGSDVVIYQSERNNPVPFALCQE